MLSDLLSVKLCSVLGIKEGIRAAAMRRGGLVLFDPHIYNRSLGPADQKGIRPAREVGPKLAGQKITIGTALVNQGGGQDNVARRAKGSR